MKITVGELKKLISEAINFQDPQFVKAQARWERMDPLVRMMTLNSVGIFDREERVHMARVSKLEDLLRDLGHVVMKDLVADLVQEL